MKTKFAPCKKSYCTLIGSHENLLKKCVDFGTTNFSRRQIEIDTNQYQNFGGSSKTLCGEFHKILIKFTNEHIFPRSNSSGGVNSEYENFSEGDPTKK